PNRGWKGRTPRPHMPRRRSRHALELRGISRYRIGTLDPRAHRIRGLHRATHGAGAGNRRAGENTVLLALGEGVAVHGLARFVGAAACRDEADRNNPEDGFHGWQL